MDSNVVVNRRAHHRFSISERFEAGLVLHGSEVKALREGKGQIAEAFGHIDAGEAWIIGMHISPYSGASTHVDVQPDRRRKLLLKRKEIEHLATQTLAKGKTLVPLRVYFTHGLAKVELGLATGKKTIDRRREIAERDAKRQIDRISRRREKG